MPNYLINSVLNKIPTPIRWAIGIALLVSLAFFLWYKGAQLWNGIGNYLFHKQINAEREKVQKELESAVEQKKQLEQTLTELAVAKKELEIAKAETDELKKVFNDQSATAKEKVEAFKSILKSEPVKTSTDNITNSDLCERARAMGASAATIEALCQP